MKIPAYIAGGALLILPGGLEPAVLSAQMSRQSPAISDGQSLATEATIFYKMKGTKSLHPSRVSDDGQRTYVEWPQEVELPAVFAVNEQGDEVLVDGYMRDGRYTIDRIFRKLVFRLDKAMASAERMQVYPK